MCDRAAAFSRASSSSACAAQVGGAIGANITLSRRLRSFSCSMLSFLAMMAKISASNSCEIPATDRINHDTLTGKERGVDVPESSLAETSKSSMPFSRPHSRSSASSSSYSSIPLPLSWSGDSDQGPLLFRSATAVCVLRSAAPFRLGGVSRLLERESGGDVLAGEDMLRGADLIDVKDVKRGRM